MLEIMKVLLLGYTVKLWIIKDHILTVVFDPPEYKMATSYFTLEITV